jgi:CDP-diacylglycerol---serine O-phosphatidyltransferase
MTGGERISAVSARMKRLKTLPVAPTVLTAGNLAAGITAILCAAHNELFVGAIMIFVAMICDMFDGKVARMTKQDGPFGAELDSLSDVVSFGVAPAILVHRLVLGQPGVFDDGIRILWFLTVFYPVMAAIRLARYNVEHAYGSPQDKPGGTPHFRGIPSPGAAGLICAWIILHQRQPEWLPTWLASPTMMREYTGLLHLDLFRWLILLVMTGAAVLMVSTIRFPHLGNSFFGRIGFGKMILLLAVVVFLVWAPAATLVIATTAYVLIGVLGAAWRAIARLRAGKSPDEDDDDDAEDVGLPTDSYHKTDGPAVGR